MAIRSSIGVIPGLLLGAATGGILALVPPDLARAIAANLLTLIAAVYVGFGWPPPNGARWSFREGRGRLPHPGRTGVVAERMVAGGGLVLHGFWDPGHHRGGVPGRQIPAGNPLFCAAYDWALAVGLLWVFSLGI